MTPRARLARPLSGVGESLRQGKAGSGLGRNAEVRAQAGNRPFDVRLYIWVTGAGAVPVGVGDHDPQQLPGHGPAPCLDQDTMGANDQQVPLAQFRMGDPFLC